MFPSVSVRNWQPARGSAGASVLVPRTQDRGARAPLTPASLCVAVIRAKVVGEKEVGSGNDIYGNPIKRIEYEIKQIKVRGPVPRLPPRAGRAAGG